MPASGMVGNDAAIHALGKVVARAGSRVLNVRHGVQTSERCRPRLTGLPLAFPPLKAHKDAR
jgi:hypothetical protein